MSTRAQLLAEIAAQFPDNTTGLITPAKLRQVTEDLANSCAVPAAGTGSVAAADITDASASGRTVLTGTPAQAREAIGFGGTVTVAQLNAAGADARSALYYCSDCLTVNGPGSLVAWCGRTLTWRTLDDCLLATTAFTAWVNDFIRNSNAGTRIGRMAGLFSFLDSSTNLSIFQGLSSGTARVGAESNSGRMVPKRISITGVNPTGGARQYSQERLTFAPSGAHVFCGARAVAFSSLGAGLTVRIGLGSAAPSNGLLLPYEETLCFDPGDKLGGLNGGLSGNWISCIRSNSVNLSGSGATTVAPVLDSASPQDVCVVRLGTRETSFFVNSSIVASGSSASNADRVNIFPQITVTNDGVSTTSVALSQSLFCFGYYLP